MWDAIQFFGSYLVVLSLLLVVYYHAQRIVKQKLGK